MVEYFVEDMLYVGELLHLVRYDVLINIIIILYVIPCSLGQHQHFAETFASLRPEDESSGLICIGVYQTTLCYSQQDSYLLASSSSDWSH